MLRIADGHGRDRRNDRDITDMKKSKSIGWGFETIKYDHSMVVEAFNLLRSNNGSVSVVFAIMWDGGKFSLRPTSSPTVLRDWLERLRDKMLPMDTPEGFCKRFFKSDKQNHVEFISSAQVTMKKLGRNPKI